MLPVARWSSDFIRDAVEREVDRREKLAQA